MSKKKNVVLMAWGGAKETAQQVTEFNKYTGILPVSIIALNPNKAELSKILGRDIEEDPSYIIERKMISQKHCVLNYLSSLLELNLKESNS